MFSICPLCAKDTSNACMWSSTEMILVYISRRSPWFYRIILHNSTNISSCLPLNGWLSFAEHLLCTFSRNLSQILIWELCRSRELMFNDGQNEFGFSVIARIELWERSAKLWKPLGSWWPFCIQSGLHRSSKQFWVWSFKTAPPAPRRTQFSAKSSCRLFKITPSRAGRRFFKAQLQIKEG